ncbi:DUF4832 domain-containing protein [candidate division KSB1 bacterium]|nr:DUF4832 domain-containing protein [candidate division KSB1 bacterium]
MVMRKSSLLLLLCLTIAGFSALQAQNKITVYPQEYPDALSNPLKGFRPDANKAGNPNYPYPTIVRDYIRWNQIENETSDGVQKIIDFCNKRWANFESKNVKVIPRVYIDWDSNIGNEYWPADLTSGDWSSQEFKDRVVKLVYKLGQAWDTDPRVAWVQTGIIGYWGEQESPVGVDEDGWDQRLGDAFTKAFHNKKLVVRNQNDWPDYEMGVYWDSYGHPGQRSGAWNAIRNMNKQGRYLSQVVEGEVAYNWGESSFDPLYGGEPEITLNSSEYTDNMIDVIRELHCTGLGWIASYDLDGSYGTNPETIKANASRMQKEFGYRFVIPEFSCSPRADQGGPLDINFNVKNVGSAPFYENWDLAFFLVDESTHEIVWTEVLPDVDITKWHPGDNYDYKSRTYQTPAEEYKVDASLSVPTDITTGQYMAGLTILEPYSQTPGVFFAVENFLAKSQTQPLCRIGIGQDITGGHDINSAIFGDPLVDDARYYTLTPQGTSFTLTTNAPNGSISPSGGTYLPGTVVTLTATGNLGYVFNSWGGDLSGSENPTTITMDADKRVTAIFDSVPVYELLTNATNGSIDLDPAGGIYEEGTQVTLTAIPEFGYTFSSWSGDLSGTENPVVITMDADKNVTANFVSVPVYEITTSAVNGSIELDPEGGRYEEGTKVTVRAVPEFGYRFSEWGGDLSGSKNPETITVDSDKNISAAFDHVGGGTLVFATNCGGSAYTSGDGVEYSADKNNSGGSTYSTTSAISGTTDDPLYQTERYGGTFGYNIPLPDGEYEVTLMFAEIFQSSAGSRVFNVSIEGDEVIGNLDIWAKVGKNAAYIETHPVTVNDGKLNISFTTIADNAKISAIKVIEPDAGAGVNQGQTLVPANTQLAQNYPNPFNLSTIIPYQLDEASHVKLSIYNTLGQHVITLIDERLVAGYHTVTWNANDTNGEPMASGIYMYQLKTSNNSIQTKKLIFTK